MTHTEQTAGIGHNQPDEPINIGLRLFNSVGQRFPPDARFSTVPLMPGSTIRDLFREYGVQQEGVFLIMVNGRDVTRSLYGGLNTDYELSDGDVVACSGPVPYSWGYGSPVV